jgi:spermidine/putrescine transport system permease protein
MPERSSRVTVASVQAPSPTAPALSTGVAALPRRARTNWLPYALLLPGMLWLTVFFVVPMVTLFSQSLQQGSVDAGYAFTGNVAIYGEALSAYWEQLVRSIGYAATATVLALLLGYPLAYFMAQKAGRWKNVLLVLVIAPFFTSFLIRTLAWQTILSDSGWVVSVARSLHLTDVLQALGLTEGDRLMSSKFSVICGLTYNFLPFMILPLYASLERLDSRLVEAAADLYASPARAFRHVTWPLSLPGVVAGTLLTFIPAAGDFINSKLLGSTQTVMIGQVIDAQFLRVLNYPLAAALSFVLLVLIVTLVALYVRKAGTEELV